LKNSVIHKSNPSHNFLTVTALISLRSGCNMLYTVEGVIPANRASSVNDKSRSAHSCLAQSSNENQIEYLDNDIAVFEEIGSILSESNVPFLYHYDHHSLFPVSVSIALNHFSDRCYNPHFEFYDADMETRKADLLCACDELIWLFCGLTTLSSDAKTMMIDDTFESGERIHQATLNIKKYLWRDIRTRHSVLHAARINTTFTRAGQRKKTRIRVRNSPLFRAC